MKLPVFRFFSILSVALIAASLPVHAEPPVAESVDVHETMETMGDNFKIVRKALRDDTIADVDAVVKAVETIESGLKACLEATPSAVSDAEGAERKKLAKAYRGGIEQTLKEIPALKAALKKGDVEASRAAAKKIGGIRGDGHDALGVD